MDLREWILDDLKRKCEESEVVWIKINRVESVEKFMKVCE